MKQEIKFQKKITLTDGNNKFVFQLQNDNQFAMLDANDESKIIATYQFGNDGVQMLSSTLKRTPTDAGKCLLECSRGCHGDFLCAAECAATCATIII